MTEQNTSSPSQSQLDALAAENSNLKAQVAQFKREESVRAEREKLVAAKMAKGLTRQQALAVIDRQAAFDKSEPARPKTTATPKPKSPKA